MKQLMAVVLAAILLLGCGTFLYHWLTRPVSLPAEPNPLQLPQMQTVPETTAAPLVEETTQATVYVPVSHKPVADPAYRLKARNAFVYNCASGELVFTLGDMQKQIAPASLTKLFTAYVALQYLDPDMTVTCGQETTWINPLSSVSWVSPGDRVTVDLLIRGMMMQSGNDAAYAAAVAAGRVLAEDQRYPAKQALALFMEEVNRQARQLGLTGTHFSTPDGLDAFDHYTTAEDMLAIALLAMDQPLLRHYSSLSKTSVMYENGETYTYHSTNYLLQPDSEYYCADACGMKTGTTKKAGSCLMSLFHNGEGYILIGVFGCPQYDDRFADALQLYAVYG